MGERISKFLFLVPAIILIAIFVYGGIGWNFWVSLTNWHGLTPSYKITGFDQYTKLFGDPVFWTSFTNNLLLILIFVPGSLLLGLCLAVLLDRKVRGENVFRTIYLLPFALSFVVTATLWAWMYNPRSGVINTILEEVGLGFLKTGWITDPNIALYCIIVALIWQFSGYTMIIYMAGMRSIPQIHYEAAKVDGASVFQLYTRVIIPQLTGSTLSAFVVLMVFALKSFSFIWVLTSGGPGYSTFTLAIQMYKATFSKSQFAYGSAIANVLLALTLVIVLPYLYWSQKERT